MLQLFDTYSATYSVLIIGFAECVTLAWVYGKILVLDWSYSIVILFVEGLLNLSKPIVDT